MPVVDTNDLELLRREGQSSDVYGSFLKPLTLWAMQLDVTPDRGDTSLTFDGGNGSHFAAVVEYQTCWIGTNAGQRDIGVARIRSISSGDSGVTGTIVIAANSFILGEDYYLTVKHNYEFDPMYPYIDDDEDFFKDRDIAYANQTRFSEPVGILGLSHRAGFIRDGEAAFFVDASTSYAVSPGAAVTTYALTSYPTTGVTITFNTSTGIGRVVCTSLTQEYYWLKLTVTDDNGDSQVTYRCIFAHDPDRTGVTYPAIDFKINQLSSAWNRGGWHAQVEVDDNVLISELPDNTFCVLWRERKFDFGDVNVTKRDGAMQFVNPKIGYQTVPNGASQDVTLNFHAGVLVDGVLAADSTAVNVDVKQNAGSPVPKAGTVTDGVVSISHTFISIANSGSLYVEDEANTQTLVSRTYVQANEIVEVPDWPSLLRAYPRSLIVGYFRNENIQQSLTPTSGRGLDTFNVTTIEDLLKNQYMFSISMASRPDGDVGEWYEIYKELTIGRACHHIWKWHSTLFVVADVFGLTDNTDGRAYAEFEGGTLYSMPDNMARNAGIRAHVVCNKDGQLHLTQDAQLLTDTERDALTVVGKFDKEDLTGEIGILRDVEDRVAFVYASGLEFHATYSPDENGVNQPDAEPYCATAPGDIPSGDGEGTINLERQVVRSQTHVNQIAGRVYGQANNPYPEIRLKFHADYLDILDVHLAEWWQMDIEVDDTIRGFVWNDKKLLVRELTCSVHSDTGQIELNGSFEPEVAADIGVSASCFGTEIPETGGVPIPVPIILLAGTIVTGS